MKTSGGVVLIIIGLLVLYVAVSGKYDCFVAFFECLFDSQPIQTPSGNAPAQPPTKQSSVLDRVNQRYGVIA